MAANTEHNPVSRTTDFTRNMANQQARQAREMFFNPFLAMQEQMGRMMVNTMENFTRIPQSMTSPLEKVMPKVGVWEDSEAFYLETKVPGMSPEDIDVSISENAMTITCGSEKVSEQAEKGETLYQKHNACRTVMIPDNVATSKAEAEIRGDALRIKLPKKKTASGKGKKISVKRAA